MGCGDDAGAARVQRKQCVVEDEFGREGGWIGQIDCVSVCHSVPHAFVRQCDRQMES